MTALAVIVAFAGLANSAWAAGPASPLLSNQASPGGSPAGAQIFDSATLGLGVAPTGTITFKLYGPADPSCSAAPLLTTNTVVQGNGYYQSSAFVTSVAGTYHWTARYNGDTGNNPTATTSCSDPAGAVYVDKRRPILSGDASEVSGAGTINDTATLSSASGPAGPTGTMTFRLYGPNDVICAAGVIFTTVTPVSGEGAYPSASFRPAAPGTYRWIVIYSGDANNWFASTTCTDPANAVVLTSVSVVTATPATVNPAGQLTVTWSNIAAPSPTDWIALQAVGTPDGAVIAWKYTNGSASASTTLTVPWGTVPGSYEIRLFANNGYQRLATSQPISVVAP